jgi:hypothetical protein
MPQRLPHTPVLSVHRAFVVHFAPGTDAVRGQVVGRVEHLVSGEATEFRSIEELLAFFGRLLHREETRSDP